MRGEQIVVYADDLVIINKRRNLMEAILREIGTEGRQLSLEINREKKPKL